MVCQVYHNYGRAGTGENIFPHRSPFMWPSPHQSVTRWRAPGSRHLHRAAGAARAPTWRHTLLAHAAPPDAGGRSAPRLLQRDEHTGRERGSKHSLHGDAEASVRRQSPCAERQSPCANPHDRPSRQGDTSSFTLTSPSRGRRRRRATRTHPAWIGARTLTFRVVLSMSVAHAL